MHRQHSRILRALQDHAVIERFWATVNVVDGTDDCWEWLGYVSSAGHPAFRVGSHSVSAARVAWFTRAGEMPVGGRLHHHCENLRCVRPSHLVWAVSRSTEDLLDTLEDGYVSIPSQVHVPVAGPGTPRVLRLASGPRQAAA